MVVHERILHDATIGTAVNIMEILEGCILPQERADAFEEIARCVRAGIQAYLLHTQRQQERLRPQASVRQEDEVKTDE